MKLVFRIRAWEDHASFQADEPHIAERINELIAECLRNPFVGTGKPEPLKKNLAGWWSRRITREHRLVYRMRGSGDEQTLEILSCRYHH